MEVSWRKVSNEQVLTVGLVSFVDDPRLEVEHPPGSIQWNLVIRDLQPGDAGVYECQVSSKSRHLRHHVTLLVKEEPKLEDQKKPNIQITGADFVDEGEKINLVCNATAKDQPPEDLDWFREGNRLQTNDITGISIRKFVTLATGTIVSILEIKHASLSDGGVYVCRTSSLDVTSFRVNVLNGDTYNVKRVLQGYCNGVLCRLSSVLQGYCNGVLCRLSSVLQGYCNSVLCRVSSVLQGLELHDLTVS
ncbi:zwei Ig domain protein zig-8-like [Littorina saxatilis]|uniref:zwei Ig domain protein zig-8-like n=1 Tax=Littorina saxatilis TaxID=31220 RepID=UPI0038B4DB8C